MHGLDYKAEGMDPTLGLPASMMDNFQRHYGLPPPPPHHPSQGGYNPWAMMPSLGAVATHPNMTPHHMGTQKGGGDAMSGQGGGRGGGGAGGYGQQGQAVENGGPLPNLDRTPPSPPAARERFSYTRYQLELLNVIYEKIRYPNTMQKQLIAKRVGITRDQVKIWFQNRRRKDITGKRNGVNPTDVSMVPTDILQGVVTELLQFENDPKGKKVTESMKEYKKKVAARRKRVCEVLDQMPEEMSRDAKRQRHLSNESTSTTHSSGSIPPLQSTQLPEIFYAGDASPQGSNTDGPIVSMSRLSPNSRSTDSTSFSSDHTSPYQIHNIDDSAPSTPYSPNDSTGSITSPGEPPLVIAPAIVPSAEQLDMNAPPNVVALPLTEATLERPRSLESPALGPRIDGAVQPETPPQSQDTDRGLGLNASKSANNENERRQEAPPNTVAPPSDKLDFALKKQALENKNKPSKLSVNIPHDKLRSHVPAVSQNLNVSSTSSSDSLTTPSPVQLFCNSTTPQAWEQPLNAAQLDKSTSQPQYPNDYYTPTQYPTDLSSNVHAEPLSAHYEKVFAPYMVGFFPPNQAGYMTHAQSQQVENMYKEPNKAAYMFPGYPVPFGSYEVPSDLSIKKPY